MFNNFLIKLFFKLIKGYSILYPVNESDFEVVKQIDVFTNEKYILLNGGLKL